MFNTIEYSNSQLLRMRISAVSKKNASKPLVFIHSSLVSFFPSLISIFYIFQRVEGYAFKNEDEIPPEKVKRMYELSKEFPTYVYPPCLLFLYLLSLFHCVPDPPSFSLIRHYKFELHTTTKRSEKKYIVEGAYLTFEMAYEIIVRVSLSAYALYFIILIISLSFSTLTYFIIIDSRDTSLREKEHTRSFRGWISYSIVWLTNMLISSANGAQIMTTSKHTFLWYSSAYTFSSLISLSHPAFSCCTLTSSIMRVTPCHHTLSH